MPRKLELSGKKFGKLTVIKRSNKKGKTCRAMWQCLCECGNKKDIYSHSLTNGKSKSCGCSQHTQRGIAHNRIDLTNKKFGKLLVITDAPTKNHQARWLCHCDCGNKKIIIGSKLRRGETKSCGCLRHVAYNWKGHEGISANYWSSVKRHASKKNRPLTITIQEAWEKFINQNQRCALSGVPLYFSRDVNRKKRTNRIVR